MRDEILDLAADREKNGAMPRYSERVPGGLRDYDRTTRQLVAIEVWDASTRLPANLLDALPSPSERRDVAA